MHKSIEVRTDYSHGKAHLLASLPANGKWDCDVNRALLTIGYLTSPPRYQGLSLSNYWAWLRYGLSIDDVGQKLKLRDLWSDMDPHQKTILADDFGMGFTCHYLVDQHGFEDFSDTNFLLRHMLKGTASLKKTPTKKGAAKSPDFIAVDGLNRLHILECKGTQSSRAYLKKAMAKGRLQKLNISSAKGTFSTSMVGGIYVPLHNAKHEAELVFLDPEPSDELIELSKLGRGTLVKGVRRVSLAKMLSAVGLWQAATVVYEGTSEFIDPTFIRDIKKIGLRFSGFDLNSAEGRYERIVEHRSFEPLENNSKQLGGYTTRLKLSVPASLVGLFAKDSFSSGGHLPQKVVDEWVADELRSRRRKHEVKFLTRVPPSKAPGASKRPSYKEDSRLIKGSWRNVSDEPDDEGLDAFTGVVTGEGFGLAVERKRFE